MATTRNVVHTPISPDGTTWQETEIVEGQTPTSVEVESTEDARTGKRRYNWTMRAQFPVDQLLTIEGRAQVRDAFARMDELLRKQFSSQS